MFKQPVNVAFKIPAAISDYAAGYRPTDDLSEQMRFVVDASHLNIDQQFGGPFAAAIFERQSGALIALGTNLVTSENLSILHAEMVAISLAQRKLGSFDLSEEGLPDYDLFTSCEPCTMCLGATHWSGVTRVVAAARDEDAAEIGFDEGPKPGDWVAALQQRDIDVIIDIERPRARKVLQHFRDSGGPVYQAMRNRDAAGKHHC